MEIKEISESEIENITKYVISTLYRMDIFTESIFSDSIKHTNNVSSYMENNFDIAKEYISTFISFYKFSKDKKNYSKLNKLIDSKENEMRLLNKGIPEIMSYYYFVSTIGFILKIEILDCIKEYYELSEFERVSVVIFGKNFFSGKEFDTPEYREFS